MMKWFRQWLVRNIRPGQQFVLRESWGNPFKQTTIEVLAVKEGWVQYYFVSAQHDMRKYSHELSGDAFWFCYRRR